MSKAEVAGKIQDKILVDGFTFNINDQFASLTRQIDDKVCEVWKIERKDILRGIECSDKLQKLKEILVADKQECKGNIGKYNSKLETHINKYIDILEGYQYGL